MKEYNQSNNGLDNERLKEIRSQLNQHRNYLETLLVNFETAWPSQLNQSFTEKGSSLLRELDERLHRLVNIIDGTFYLNVSVLGNYSSGKSTFLNSFLQSPDKKGVELPHDEEPITCKLTEIRPGELELHKETTAGEISKLNVDYSNINDVLKKMASHKEKSSDTSTKDELRKVILQIPFPDFVQGIRFYDTPGFDSPRKDELSKDSLAKSDVIIWLIDINDGEIHKDLLDKMNEYKDIGERNIIVLNKIDEKPPQDREEILRKVKDTSPFSSKEVLLYSAEEVQNTGMLFTVSQIQRWISNWLDDKIKNLDDKTEFEITYSDDVVFSILSSYQHKLKLEIDYKNNELKARYGSNDYESVRNATDKEYRDTYLEMLNMLNSLHQEKVRLFLQHLSKWKKNKLFKEIKALEDNVLRLIKRIYMDYADEKLTSFKSDINNSKEVIKQHILGELDECNDLIIDDYLSEKGLLVNIEEYRRFLGARRRRLVFQNNMVYKANRIVNSFHKELEKSLKTKCEECLSTVRGKVDYRPCYDLFEEKTKKLLSLVSNVSKVKWYEVFKDLNDGFKEEEEIDIREDEWDVRIDYIRNRLIEYLNNHSDTFKKTIEYISNDAFEDIIDLHKKHYETIRNQLEEIRYALREMQGRAKEHKDG